MTPHANDDISPNLAFARILFQFPSQGDNFQESTNEDGRNKKKFQQVSYTFDSLESFLTWLAVTVAWVAIRSWLISVARFIWRRQ